MELGPVKDSIKPTRLRLQLVELMVKQLAAIREVEQQPQLVELSITRYLVELELELSEVKVEEWLI